MTTEKKGFRQHVIDGLVNRQTLTATQQRRLWARASTAKRMILRVIAPELLELKVRVEALEMFAIRYVNTSINDEDLEQLLREIQGKIRSKIRDKDPDAMRLDGLGGDAREEVWKGVEDLMVQDIVNKQRESISNKPKVQESGDDQDQG